MNKNIFKIVILSLLSIVPIVFNWHLFFNKDKLFLRLSIMIITIFCLLFYLLDYFILKNDLKNYIAINLLLSFLLSITFEDIKTNMMDMRVIIGYFIVFFIYRVLFLDLAIFLEGLTGFALSLVILLIAYFVKRDSIGIGDIAAISTCGMIIGFPNIFHFLFKAFLFVFIYGLYLIISKKKNTMTEIPLAPFLLLATIL